jgi:S-DNA-T family DNA segregation ATPase FtsK/SpoIIIE
MLAVILISIWLGFFSESNEVFGAGPGGRHGHYMSQFLVSLIGNFGTFLLLIVATAGYLFYSFEKSLPIAKRVMMLFVPVKSSGKNAENIASEDNESFYPEKARNDEKVNFKEEGDDLVFETEFPQHERLSDTEKFTVRNLEDSQPDNIDSDDIELLVESPYGGEDETEPDSTMPLEDYDPTLELSGYVLPNLELLDKHDSGNSAVTNEELISNKNKIVETLGHYKIQIDKIKATIGPTVTLYEIVPAPGVRISKIKNLEDDIALNLSALGIRIIAPIPGKGTIGIEVPNQTPEIVSMRSLIASKRFQESDFDLAIALGKTISNETYVFDLAKMPHLLVAGATGQGKSVGLNAIIASLLYKKHPSQLKFVLIDPKKVELTLYSRIENHYLAKIPDSEEAIITDTQKVIYTLNSLTIEMDQRYDLLKKAQVRNIKEYNRKFIKRKLNPENGHRFMPYIVVIIDEFADLIMTAGREVETPLARLAQLARAIGIHLVIATQRPTTNIITGVIKANFPARIAFRVTSMIDSRTILDTPGANQLIGRGDLLFAPGSDLTRLQCAFIDIPELERITTFIGDQRSYPTPYFLPEYIDENSGDSILDVDLSKRDSLFNDAARLVVAHQQGSTSLIQRKFAIGYNRAGRIVDQLEAAGIVGPFEGSKARQVMFPDEYSLEQFLKSLDV